MLSLPPLARSVLPCMPWCCRSVCTGKHMRPTRNQKSNHNFSMAKKIRFFLRTSSSMLRLYPSLLGYIIETHTKINWCNDDYTLINRTMNKINRGKTPFLTWLVLLVRMLVVLRKIFTSYFAHSQIRFGDSDDAWQDIHVTQHTPQSVSHRNFWIFRGVSYPYIFQHSQM